MDYLYDKHYAVSTLDTQWSTLRLVGETLGERIPRELKVDFQFVKDEGKETKDDKFPIPRRLLLKLCEASNIILMGYNVLLAKNMFLCTWAFSMRISEFSKTKTSPVGSQKSHNLWAEVITTDADSLSACFESDKTSLYHKSPRHRTILWYKLPDFCRSTVEAFTYVRSDGAQFFFCTEMTFWTFWTCASCIQVTNFCT